MPLKTPTILLGFLLPWTWDISSWLLQQSAATAPYLGCGVAPIVQLLEVEQKSEYLNSQTQERSMISFKIHRAVKKHNCTHILNFRYPHIVVGYLTTQHIIHMP